MKSLLTVNLLLSHDSPFPNRPAAAAAARACIMNLSFTIQPHSPRATLARVANVRAFLPITIKED